MTSAPEGPTERPTLRARAARRRRRHLAFGVFLLSLIGVGLAAAGPLVGRLVLRRLQERLSAQTGGALAVESFEADFFSGTFRFTGFRYEQKISGRRSIVTTADSGSLDLALGSLFGGGLVIDELRLKTPKIKYQQWSRSTERRPARAPGRVTIRRLVLAGGELAFEDFSREVPARLRLELTELVGRDLSTHEPLSFCARLKAVGSLGEGRAPFRIEGDAWAAEPPRFSDAGASSPASSCRIEGLALAPLAPYFLSGLPVGVKGGELSGRVRYQPAGAGAISVAAALDFRGVEIDISGPLAFLARQSGIPDALERRGGSFAVEFSESFSAEEVHGFAGDFLARFFGVAGQHALAALTTR